LREPTGILEAQQVERCDRRIERSGRSRPALGDDSLLASRDLPGAAIRADARSPETSNLLVERRDRAIEACDRLDERVGRPAHARCSESTTPR
jgi:hypothetical protein